jgi:hypothetical protein
MIEATEILDSIAADGVYAWTQGEDETIHETLQAMVDEGQIVPVSASRKIGSRLLTYEYVAAILPDPDRPKSLIGIGQHHEKAYSLFGDPGNGVNNQQYWYEIEGATAPVTSSGFKSIVRCGQAARYEIKKSLGLEPKEVPDDETPTKSRRSRKRSN